MQDEQWKRIEGFPDYEVSSLGRVVSYKRARPAQLAGGWSGPGYRNVLLHSPTERRHRKVHQLVAEAFLGPRPVGAVIRHLDGNMHNNAATNLAYGTPSENERDKARHGTKGGIAKTHCVHGHEYTPENTLIENSKMGPKRRCRTCSCARLREGRLRAKVRQAA